MAGQLLLHPRVGGEWGGRVGEGRETLKTFGPRPSHQKALENLLDSFIQVGKSFKMAKIW